MIHGSPKGMPNVVCVELQATTERHVVGRLIKFLQDPVVHFVVLSYN